MFVLARSVAVPGVHTRLANLETSSPLLAALGAADDVDLVHPTATNWTNAGRGVSHRIKFVYFCTYS
jgi:hypothetical protein